MGRAHCALAIAAAGAGTFLALRAARTYHRLKRLDQPRFLRRAASERAGRREKRMNQQQFCGTGFQPVLTAQREGETP
jgi:hypothetical protein